MNSLCYAQIQWFVGLRFSFRRPWLQKRMQWTLLDDGTFRLRHPSVSWLIGDTYFRVTLGIIAVVILTKWNRDDSHIKLLSCDPFRRTLDIIAVILKRRPRADSQIKCDVLRSIIKITPKLSSLFVKGCWGNQSKKFTQFKKVRIQ